MELYTLFISYRHGNHYCGVYPSLEYLHGVIKEMIDGEEIPTNELPPLNGITEHLQVHDDFWHEFSNSTWIHINEVSGQLVDLIKQTALKERS